MVVSPDGSRIFVTGKAGGYGTVAYDAGTGAQLWERRYEGPGASVYDTAYSLAVNPDGSRVFVTGQSTGITGNEDYVTLAYDAVTGAQLWARRYNGPGDGDDGAYSVAMNSDGSRVLVTGYSTGITGNQDFATLAYDAVTGAQLWARRYNGPDDEADVGYQVALSPDGSKAFVTGYSTGSLSNTDWLTLAYDAITGAKVWATRYNGPGNSYERALSLSVNPDGSSVYVTGYGDSAGGYLTVAYDSQSGVAVWAETYGVSYGAQDEASSVSVSPDGSRVFITGYSSIREEIDYATVAYDAASGAQLWVRRYSAGNYGIALAKAVRVSPDGTKVFVTGYAAPSFCTDFLTIAYDAETGGGLWAQRLDGGSCDDLAFALAVSPDGSRVFVTGESGLSEAYETVAYEA